MTTPHDRAVLNTILNPLMPVGEFVDPEEEPELRDEDDETEASREAKKLEVEGIKAAESGDLEAALKYFNAAIGVMPSRPAGYNNRAQALRLMGDDDAALADLEKAIKLSNAKGKSGCQALTQRGCIMRKLRRDDDARRDFEAAAMLGNPFAKTQAIQLNPYAALCNKMLHDVVHKLQHPPEEHPAK